MAIIVKKDMMNLKQTIKQLPPSAGIYQYFDKDGNLLYIGKAKNLSNRVKSYFNFTPALKPTSQLSLRITKMINQVESLNYIVVNSEHDALILENSLIKQLNPKYNILLRDDKTYPYIYIDNSKEFPRFEITRKILKSSDIKYFGPYSIGAKDILDSIPGWLFSHISVKEKEVLRKVKENIVFMRKKLDAVRKLYDTKIKQVSKAEDLSPGVIKAVKVFVAIKRTIVILDK